VTTCEHPKKLVEKLQRGLAMRANVSEKLSKDRAVGGRECLANRVGTKVRAAKKLNALGGFGGT